MLTNIKNAEATIKDWSLLMSRTKSCMSTSEQSTFTTEKHLFAMKDLATRHNKQMLKSLHVPIARSEAEQSKHNFGSDINDTQLEQTVFLCIGQEVMLTSNLWVSSGLVNGALGQVIDVVYNPESHPPDLPSFVVVNFRHYQGPPWGVLNPTHLPPTHTVANTKPTWGLTIPTSYHITI
ncbi:hypothetical protein KI387_038786 [Taxus chinensis]|uniref:DNA helicase Pif1-like 2B domain-containing protein n=1 Tax=Taxus chinensis TaxID=29808 RepID=A0AA38C9Y7_TAXCH|nr:hypothetical protein KI387_038786 [Taxus chinensis]